MEKIKSVKNEIFEMVYLEIACFLKTYWVFIDVSRTVSRCIKLEITFQNVKFHSIIFFILNLK